MRERRVHPFIGMLTAYPYGDSWCIGMIIDTWKNDDNMRVFRIEWYEEGSVRRTTYTASIVKHFIRLFRTSEQEGFTRQKVKIVEQR